MAIPSQILKALERPLMYIRSNHFDAVSAFVQGYDLASHSGVLAGFREWLIVRLDGGNNLSWSQLVLHICFPEAVSLRSTLDSEEGNTAAVHCLISLLYEFSAERDKYDGLRRIFRRYEQWLCTQDWYDPTSPQWIADDESAGSQ